MSYDYSENILVQENAGHLLKTELGWHVICAYNTEVLGEGGKIAELDHWTDKQETKAAVDNLIRDTLWDELPECYDEISISEYRQRIYEYVYTRYRVAA